ncbi:transcriptional regulator [Bacteroides graminisolvens]|uniref:transcriptional regulator n=1 Tax=Bacteroides graminisolvens TaxID=477666 RepID=UPI0023F1EB0E|nr:transcriptional regulator [Bacteroides graminisolvens]
MNTKKIGEIIKEHRQSLKVKQQELADLAGVGIDEFYLSGEGNPPVRRITYRS